MRIKCISEQLSSGNSNFALVDWANNSKLEITVDKVYVVLAISKYLNSVFYYILGDESDSYPLAFPSELFQIIDGTLSKYWEVNLTKIESLDDLDIKDGEVISFKEWKLNGDGFYENLLEGDESEVLIFNNYRDKILIEAEL